MDNERALINDLVEFIDLLTEKIEKSINNPGVILTEDIAIKGNALMERAANFAND